MKQLPLIIILILPALLSCESVVTNFEIQTREPSLNLICQANADSTVEVFLGRSMFLDESVSFHEVKDAQITILREDAGNVELEFDGDKFYKSNGLYFQEGATYQIQAQAQGFDGVSGSFSIPPKAEILNLETELREDEDNCSGCAASYKVVFKLTFEKTEDVTRYYMLDITSKTEQYEYDNNYQIVDTIIQDMLIYYESPSPLIKTSRSDGDYYYNNTQTDWAYGTVGFISDENVKLGEHSIIFEVYYYEFESNENGLSANFTIGWHSIDKNFFEYAQSRGKLDNSEDNPFVEPTSIYTNIENGIGLVYGVNRSYMEVDFNEVPESGTW